MINPHTMISFFLSHKIFKAFLVLSFFSIFPLFSYANPTLDDLLNKVLEERKTESAEFKEREQKFKTEKTNRQNLLNKAIKELKEEENLSAKLTKQFEKNEKELAVLETELQLATGVLGELFGSVKQITGDFRGQINQSLISAEIPGREEFLNKIASQKKLPNIQDLRKLWFEIQREMTEQGKVSAFKKEVITTTGDKKTKSITRIGAFNLISDGKYLNYQGDLNQIVELVKQPDRKFTRLIKKLEKAKPESHSFFAVDPSRGSLISILIKTPSFIERIYQGGLVGLVIICVLLFGLAVSVERFITIKKEEKKIKAQLKTLHKGSESPTSEKNIYKQDNPIGLIFLNYEKNKHLDIESLTANLNEVAVKYLPKVEKGIGMIKLLSVLSPLLGLLGTVTGMILTFQSITLFGTGDPKLMAGGISQALMTTVMGLASAIPLLLIHNFILSRSQNLIQILEEQTAGLLAEHMIKNKK